MFERLIHQAISDGVKRVSTAGPDGQQSTLRRLLNLPGRTEKEINDHVEFWNGEGRPKIVHAYARNPVSKCMYVVRLASEAPDHGNIGQQAGAIADQIVADVEKEIGRPVDALAERIRFRYEVYTFSTHNPDTVIAWHGILRSILYSSRNTHFLPSSFDETVFDAADLLPDQQFLPEGAFGRVTGITGFGYLLYFNDLDLGPFALGRPNAISGLHVFRESLGVEANVRILEQAE